MLVEINSDAEGLGPWRGSRWAGLAVDVRDSWIDVLSVVQDH